MKFNRCIAIIAAVFLIAISGLATADVLPRPAPENQMFSTVSVMEGVGAVSESTSVVWEVGDAGFTELLAPVVNRAADGARGGSIAYVTYKDSITTNGGQISEVKSFSMDTHQKTAGIFNIETTKVLTYTSQNGSHLMGEESYVLDVAGNWSFGIDDIVCVFARAGRDYVPPFCNKVTASSKLTSITTAQVETIGGLTAIGETASVPAALKYEISVTPDANSASGYADGIVSTTFTVSVMEGRSDFVGANWWANQFGNSGVVEGDTVWIDWWNDQNTPWDELGARTTFIDTATVAGGISTFNKAFDYQSGIVCENCI